MKKKLLWLSCLLLCGALFAMEPEERRMITPETTLEEPSDLFKELMKMGGWVGRIAEILPGEIPAATATRISQVLAQEVLRNGPPIRKFILSHLLTFKECVGHTRMVNSAEFNRIGDKVVTASNDGTARIWDVETGETLCIARIWPEETPFLEGHTSLVNSARFNCKGDKVVSVSDDGTARTWDVETGRVLSVLEGHIDAVKSVAFNRTGDKVVTASNDGTARIWDVETGRALGIFEGPPVWVYSARFNRTGDKVVTASVDGTVRIEDVETGRTLRTLEGHTDILLSVAFNRTGDKVVTASNDGTARIWDVGTGRALSILEGHTGQVRSAEFNRTGDKVVAVFYDGTVLLWDLKLLLESEKFLTEDISLYQVAILNDIFEVMIARHYLAIHRKEAPRKVAHLEGVTLAFDFNRYPPCVWDWYAGLPEAIRNLFDTYIIKRVSASEEGINIKAD